MRGGEGGGEGTEENRKEDGPPVDSRDSSWGHLKALRALPCCSLLEPVLEPSWDALGRLCDILVGRLVGQVFGVSAQIG